MDITLPLSSRQESGASTAKVPGKQLDACFECLSSQCAINELFCADFFSLIYFKDYTTNPFLFDFNYNSINNDFGHRNNHLQLGPNMLGSQVKGSSQARLFNARGLLTISVEQWLIFISHAVVHFSSPLSFSRMKLLTNQLN